MTDNPCNCYNNCNHFEDKEYGMVCKLKNDDYGLTQSYVNLTMRCGCMSHPLSREYLMKDIIEKIEEIRDLPLKSHWKERSSSMNICDIISLIKQKGE